MELNDIAWQLSKEQSEDSFRRTFVKLQEITEPQELAVAVWQLLGWYWLIGHEKGYKLRNKREND